MQVNPAQIFFEVEVKDLEVWTRRPYKNNFFELVYVESGEGIQCINYKDYHYSSGNIFLLPPLNCHSFKISKPSRFYFVRFSDQYFANKSSLTDYKTWFEKASYILANYNRLPGDIISSDSEREYIINSIKTIYKEYNAPDNYSETIILGAVASILNFLARNIEHKYLTTNVHQTDSKFRSILRYINNNLLDNDKINLPALSEKFNISKGYFSEYFKKQSGNSLTDYIIKAKLRLAETYILHSDQSLKEIAFHLNFSDSSHLSNTFKKNYGMTVKEYKQNASSVCRMI